MIEIDIAVDAGDWAEEAALRRLAEGAIAMAAEECGLRNADSELSVLFADDARIRELNRDWRGKNKATNVLSFPATDMVPGATLPPILGDIALAHETIAREAALDGKPFDHHLSHLLIHGFLHLLGHDHETESEAERMEGLERQALARLAIPDPYG